MPTKQVLLLSLFCKTLFTVSEILGAEMRPASMTLDSCQMHFLLNLPDKEPATPLLPLWSLNYNYYHYHPQHLLLPHPPQNLPLWQPQQLNF